MRVRVLTSEGQILWAGSQKKLFRKYASDRKRAMEHISSAVTMFCSDGTIPAQPAPGSGKGESGGGCAIL